MGANTTITVYAPYNFVPFSEEILEYLKYKEAVPDHDAVDPALKTGEIHVTLTADTPVFVSDGDKKKPHFFKGPDGRYMLPGSTIRGMIRANMQILGFGLVRSGEDIEDQRVFFRKIADAGESTGGELKKYYHTALTVKTYKSISNHSHLGAKSRKNTAYSIPEAVHAGYLRKTDSGYEIKPVKGTYFRVSRDHPGVADLGEGDARAVPVAYTAGADRVKELCPVNKGSEDMANEDMANEDMAKGMLLFTGKPINPDKPNHLYLFPEADEEADSVTISKEDELSYAADWEARRNALKAYYDPDFWKLPKNKWEKDPKNEGKDPENKGENLENKWGKPVFYIQHDGHTFFGMSLFLRIGYSHSLKEGLPNHHRALEHNEAFLDWPRAILGWAGKDSSRRSRVSFGDFPAQGHPEELPSVATVLGSPKISFYPGYIVNGKHYNQEGFQLRGYKRYWLKKTGDQKGNPNVASQLHPLGEGTVFSGVIRYRNLYPEELGLLLWAIRLEKGCYQSVGMGKPYGYGRMKVSIDRLLEYDMAALYRPEGLCSGSSPADPEAVEEAVQGYIDKYDAAAAEGLNLKKPKKKPSITSREEIQDFFFLCRTIRRGKEVSYMPLKDYRKACHPLPDTASFRQKANGAVQAGQAKASAPKGDGRSRPAQWNKRK